MPHRTPVSYLKNLRLTDPRGIGVLSRRIERTFSGCPRERPSEVTSQSFFGYSAWGPTSFDQQSQTRRLLLIRAHQASLEIM